MKTNELIKKLQELDPSGQGNIEVPVGSYTKSYPSAYLEPFHVAPSPHCSNKPGVTVRIYVNFPEGFQIHEKKTTKSSSAPLPSRKWGSDNVVKGTA